MYFPNFGVMRVGQASQESLQMVCKSKDRKLVWNFYGKGLLGLNFLLVPKEGAFELTQMWSIDGRSEALKL